MLLCKLIPASPLHLGTRDLLEETSEYIHSDTLFSAFCNAYRLLYGKEELDNLLKGFVEKNPPFLLSSAFPFYRENYLFPLPKSTNLSEYSEDKKRFKKVKFVSQTIFEKILANEDVSADIKKYFLIQGGMVHLDEEVDEDFIIWQVKETPRVTIDRLNSASEIFHVTELVLSRDCGLFFLADFKGNNLIKKFKATINLLSQEGIGGERTSGKGIFKKPVFQEFSLKTNPSDSHITLSLCFPSKEESKRLVEGHYELVKRRGWVYSLDSKNRRTKGIRMIKEGSVYRGKIEGMLKDVTPDGFTSHHVYKYGYAFNVPIQGV